MSFLYPLGLLALLALPLIILFHLIRERRRRMVVPSLLLWELLPQRQDSRRRRRLPLTLLLLLHLLAAALLALALGQPRWLLDLFGEERRLALVLDLSTSMAADAPNLAGLSRLEAARMRARTLIGELGERDRVTLISAGPQARLVAPLAPAADRNAAQALEQLTIEGNGADIEGAILLAHAALDGLPAGEVVVLTDGALPDLDPDLAAREQPNPVRWEVIGGPLDNRAVIALAARPRGNGGALQLFARVANFSANPIAGQVRLFGDGQLLDVRRVRLEADGEVDLTWALPVGLSAVRVEIDGGGGLAVDDAAELSLVQVRPVQALLVSDNPAVLERALRAVPGLNVQVIASADYRAAEQFADLTVFDGILPAGWPAGGVLLVNPPLSDALPLVARERRRAAADDELVILEPGLFDGLSLGSVDFGPLRSVETPDWARVALARNDQPVVLRGRQGASEIAVWTFDLAAGNLTSRLAFPLLVARTVRNLTPAPLPGSLIVGDELVLRPSPRADSLEVLEPGGGIIRLPVGADNPAPQLTLREAGFYTIIERAGGQEIFRGGLAANAGAGTESALNPRRLPVLPAPTTSINAGTGENEAAAGLPFWPWLVAGALIMLIFEWLYVHGRRNAEPA